MKKKWMIKKNSKQINNRKKKKKRNFKKFRLELYNRLI